MKMQEPYLNQLSDNPRASLKNFYKHLIAQAKDNPLIPISQFERELASEGLFDDDSKKVSYFLTGLANLIGAEYIKLERSGRFGWFPNFSLAGQHFPNTKTSLDFVFLKEPNLIAHSIDIYSNVINVPETLDGTAETAALNTVLEGLSVPVKKFSRLILYNPNSEGSQFFSRVPLNSYNSEGHRTPLNLDDVIKNTSVALDAVQRAYLATQRTIAVYDARIAEIASKLLDPSNPVPMPTQ